MHAVVSFLDRKNTRVVRSFSKEVDRALRSHDALGTPVPHISYQGASEYKMEKLEHVLQRFASQSRRFKVHAGGLGIFTGFTPVLYVPVVRTSELSRFHLSLLRRISSNGSGLSEYYEPDLWTPHITIARTGVNQRPLAEIIGRLARKELELDITIDNLAIIHDDKGRYSVRSRFPFS